MCTWYVHTSTQNICGSIGLGCKSRMDLTFSCWKCTMCFSQKLLCLAFFPCSSIRFGSFFFHLRYSSAPVFGARHVTTDSILVLTLNVSKHTVRTTEDAHAYSGWWNETFLRLAHITWFLLANLQYTAVHQYAIFMWRFWEPIISGLSLLEILFLFFQRRICAQRGTPL